MTISIDSKLPTVGTTIFTVMSQLASEHDAINLAQGFPGFEPPDELKTRIAYHIDNGANQYAPMPGVPALTEAIAAKVLRLYGATVDPGSEITISTGATEGLFSTIQAVVRQGDEVIVFDPAYDAYEPAVSLAGGITRHVPLTVSDDEHEFQIDWNRFEDALGERTRLIILNFPHNPTGAILSAADLDRLADLVRDTGTFLMGDEVYEHIVFGGLSHQSLLCNEELRERSFVISSFGKTYHSTGWKVGYCIAPAALTAEFRRVHQFTTFTVITPIQYALADFMNATPEFADELAGFYEHKRDTFCRLLEGSRFRFEPTKSTFFQLLDYSEISDQPDTEVSSRWTRENGVASIPLSVFCETPFTGQRLRFCFAKDDETLKRAAEILSEL